MKRIGSKGQGAMEYLMTYGWAIMVVMIVGIVLWQLGVFKLGTSGTGTAGFGAVKPIDHSCSDANTLDMVVMNAAGSSVTMNITGVDVTAENGVGPIGGGDTYTVHLTATGICATGIDSYDQKLNFTYVNLITGLTHKGNGRVWGPC